MSDLSHFIVYYTGHGKGKRIGDWSLPDDSYFTLNEILTTWSRRYHTKQDQKLLIISDSCYSGHSVKKLNRYHQRKEYTNVEMIAASYNETEYGEKSDFTYAIDGDNYCPVGTIITHSLSTNLEEIVKVEWTNKGQHVKFKWE